MKGSTIPHKPLQTAGMKSLTQSNLHNLTVLDIHWIKVFFQLSHYKSCPLKNTWKQKEVRYNWVQIISGSVFNKTIDSINDAEDFNPV